MIQEQHVCCTGLKLVLSLKQNAVKNSQAVPIILFLLGGWQFFQP